MSEPERTWLPRTIGLAFFVLYATVAPAGLYWLDTPELSAAAHRLGSPHPTGFPLYLILAKAVSLMPFGEIAWRMHIASAVFGAVALGLVVAFVMEAERDRNAAVAGGMTAGLALGTTLLFARHATTAEVYAPSAAVFAVALLLYGRVARGGGTRDGLLLALLLGIGLGLHGTVRLLVVPPVAVLFLWRLYKGARWPLVTPVLVLGAALAVHLLLPVRAATGRTTTVNWGDPSTAPALWQHATASSIRDAYEKEMFSPHLDVVGDHGSRFLGQIGEYLGPVTLLLAAVGLFAVARRGSRRWLFAVLAFVALGDFVYSIWVNPMGLVDLQNGWALALVVCTLAGFGGAWFAMRLGRAAVYGGAVLALMCATPSLLAAWQPLTASTNADLARSWSEAALEQTGPLGVALSQTDSTSSGLFFLGEVEEARPDADKVVRQHLLARVPHPAGSGPGPVAFGVALASGRPIAWEYGTDGWPEGYYLELGVPMSRLSRSPPAMDDIERAAEQTRAMFEQPGAADPEAVRLEAHALTNLGRIAVMRERLDLAALLFDAAVQVRKGHAEALINRGVVASIQGDIKGALAYTERALELEPHRIQGLLNAARYRLALGENEAARRDLEHILRLEPGHKLAGMLLRELERRGP